MLREDSIIYGSLMDEYQQGQQMQELSRSVIDSAPKKGVPAGECQ